ncbi:sensor protein RstB [Janthinobacterium lividum]|uniref:histidine kinase n=1 Tax=Janthinobacterium lividum TaxID=29581 RepID=A0A1S1UAF1_9BURK|nr:ATP-binding protein [Janthinobacterium lividum]OHV97256.1 sensor protein RstB [Janthinobacterium lividum]
MKRLFWRFALLMLMAIALASCVIYFTFSRLFGDPFEHIARDQAAGQIFLLEQYIDQAPADEWLPRLNKVREVSDVTLELQPLSTVLAALPAARRAQLLQGAVVMDVSGKAFYRRVDGTGARYAGSEDDVIHAQNLPIDVGQALRMEAIRFAVIALCLLLPLGWWTRAHGRSLAALSRMADDFGRGDLAARAQVGPASSIAPLAGRINEMAERIGSLLEARRHLLLSVSHELRTPIARLEFGLALLAERHAGDDPAMRRRIDAMDVDVEELKTLVNELLGLMQLDHAQALPGQPFTLVPLLRACMAAHLPRQVDAGIADDLGELCGDPRLLARAIGNLLGNAAKYAVARIALSAARDGDALRIVIEDDGPGIPADQREQVFAPFYRLAREQDHAAAGHGLGLAIAARAVALHGGAITIDDSPLGGARFTIYIRA